MDVEIQDVGAADAAGAPAPRAQTHWRSPALAARIEAARREVEVSAQELARVAWERGVPLTTAYVRRIELMTCYPTAWHLHAIMDALGLRAEDRIALVALWAEHPKWRDQGVSWATWGQVLANEAKPLPVTRRARADRLHVRGPTSVGPMFKLWLSPTEDVLLRKTATLAGITISELIRSSVLAALQDRRVARAPEPTTARTVGHNVRLQLTTADLTTFREINCGHEFGPWVRLIVLEDLVTGRVKARPEAPQDCAPSV